MVDNKEIPREKFEQMHSQKDLDEVSNNLDKMFKNDEEDEENRQSLLDLSNQLRLNMQKEMPNTHNQNNKYIYGDTPMNTQEVNILI
jgi:hypothetical protein